MRRRRTALQVTTFPFLAVLLCAMGSLILLLLVIDRRAKVVARAKAAAQSQELADDQDARRKEEWERQRQALHALLQQQQAQAGQQLLTLQGQIGVASRQLHDEQLKVQNIEKALADGRIDLERLRTSLAKRRADMASVSQEEAKSQQAIRQLARELAELERTLDALKALRRQQTQAFSLVPYQGKRGDARKPIYVECDGTGLRFHPGNAVIPEPDVDLGQILREVAARGSERGNTYLLFLVRPNGIHAYTRAQNALQDAPIDYGYELVEADWTFDFPAEQRIASLPPPGAPPKIGFATQSPGANFGPPRAAPPPLVERGGQGGSHVPGARPGIGFESIEGGGQVNGHGNGASLVPGGSVSGGSSSIPGSGENGSGPWRAATFGNPHVVLGSPRLLPGAGPGSGEGAGYLERSMPGGNGMPQAGSERGRSMYMPGSSLHSMQQGTGQGANGTGIFGSSQGPELRAAGPQGSVAGSIETPQGAGRGSGQGMAGSVTGPSVSAPGTNVGSHAAPGSETAPGVPGTPSPPGGSRSDQPTTGSPIQGGPMSKPYETGNAGNTVQNRTGHNNATASSSGPGTDGVAGLGLPGGEAGDGPAIGQLPGPLDNMRPQNKPRPTVPLSRILGNRDYPILLDCSEDAIKIQPWGIRFDVSTLPRRPDPNHALVQTINKLIARRQATVRDGEPAYRPVLRFQIRAGGLRSYYLAYPLLEPLRLPMTRENVEEEK